MPHDRDGKLLAVGDLVLVPCRVLQIHMTEEYCNVTLESRHPMYPSQDASVFQVNSRQVVREGRISHTYREVEPAAAPQEPTK